MRHRMLQHFVLVGALASAAACGRNDTPAPARDVDRVPDSDRPATAPGTPPADTPRTSPGTVEPGTRGTTGTRPGEAAREAGGRLGAAAETADVKLALATAEGIDASGINVDTNHETKTVTLKGTVPTTDQRVRAEVVAQREATGYRINNQLVVRAR
jgi:hypothetical protein